MDHWCYICLVVVMLPGLFIASLWSPAGKGLTSWLSFVMLNFVFVTFQCGVLGQVWCLNVLVPDLSLFYYFQGNSTKTATRVFHYALTFKEQQKLWCAQIKHMTINMVFN